MNLYTRRVFIATAILIVVCTGALVAEPLSKICVVDIRRVIENFPRDSQVFRSLTRMQEQLEARMAEYDEQINELEMEILEAREEENELEVEKLKNRKADRQEDKKTYYRIMTERINSAWEEIREGEGIVDDILKAIEFVTVDNGYSMAFDLSDKSILWYSKEIDITDKVIARLRQIAR